jgi:hypothetical protein
LVQWDIRLSWQRVQRWQPSGILHHSLTEADWCIRGVYCLHHHGNHHNDNGGSMHLWSVWSPSMRLHREISQKVTSHLHLNLYRRNPPIDHNVGSARLFYQNWVAVTRKGQGWNTKQELLEVKFVHIFISLPSRQHSETQFMAYPIMN